MERAYTIDSSRNFITVVNHLNDLAQSGDYVFRGYGKQSELLPGIIRDKDYTNLENRLLTDFERYGSNYFTANTPIDFMSYAQHFGLPTRLLDFTFNPFIALSFAIYNPKSSNYKDPDDKDYYYIRYASLSENICVPVIPLNDDIYQSKFIQTDSLATKSMQCIDSVTDLFGGNILGRNISSLTGFRGIDEIVDLQEKLRNQAILFVNPNQSNQRIIMQQGLFMFPYTLDKKAHIDILNKNSRVVMIHKSHRDKLIKYLDTMGYNTFRLMPDLSSICQAIKRRAIDDRTEKSEQFKKNK